MERKHGPDSSLDRAGADSDRALDKESWLGGDDVVEVRYRNIRLAYHVKNRLIELEALLRTTREIMETVGERLGLPPEGVEIEIFQDRAEWIEHHTVIRDKDVPSWVQGDSGRVIRLILDDEKVSTREGLHAMIAHECVHDAVRKAGGKIPAWLDEGLAFYLSQDLPEAYSETLNRAVSEGAALPLELLNGRFSRFDRAIKTLAYAQSRSMVEYLVLTYGWDMIRELLSAYATDGAPDAALRKRGLNMYLLEKEWERSFR